MKMSKWLSKVTFSLLIMSLVTTSFGGAWATAAYAAEIEEQSSESGDNKAVIGGLLAVGLIAMMSGGSKDKGSTSPAKSSGNVPTEPTTTTPNQPAPTQPAPTQPTSPATKPVPSSSSLTADEQKAVSLLNADRNAKGLPALKVNMQLTRLAEQYADDMIKRGYFSHYTPEGLSPFDRMRNAGISYRYAGENLAINRNVEAAENAFMNSPGHRANILNSNYTEVGVGVRYDAKGSVYVVQEFISK